MGNGASVNNGGSGEPRFETQYLPLALRFSVPRPVVSLAHKRLQRLSSEAGVAASGAVKSIAVEDFKKTTVGQDELTVSTLQYSFLGKEPALTLGIMLEAAGLFAAQDTSVKLACFVDVLFRGGTSATKGVFTAQCVAAGCMTESEAKQLFDIIQDMPPGGDEPGTISQKQILAFLTANCEEDELEEAVDIDFSYLAGVPTESTSV